MSEPTPDVALQEWRESLANGGLPNPTRERWQPLRAGVVNLWEFEAVEYWYAHGWAQFMGRNETGKSSLMALTTLIPWLADTASDKIDTLGRSGKQFAYYVRPSGESDRRQSEASLFHGWLWVEYGRAHEGRPEFFTTLLHAAARTGSSSTRLTWCTSVGSRVREGLILTEGRAVRHAKDITAAGFEAHPNASAYRQYVASRLLGGSVAQLESIGRLLKVTRQPKLGAQLKVDFVTNHLRDALPELSRSEVEELARGWDQLDQLHADLDRAKTAAAEVAGFRRDKWQPWAAAALRWRADEVAARQTALDAVTREERRAQAELEQSKTSEAELEAQRERLRTHLAESRAQAESWRESAAYREASARAVNLHNQEVQTDNARIVAERSARAADQARSRFAQSERAHQLAQEEHERAKQELCSKEDEVCASARRAGLEPSLPIDGDHLQQASDERDAVVRQVDRSRRVAEKAAQQAEASDRTADALHEQAEQARDVAEKSWQWAAAERERVISALRKWAPTYAEPFQSAWEGGLPSTVGGLETPRLIDAIRRDAWQPKEQALTAAVAQIEAAVQAAAAEYVALAQQIEHLTGRPAVEPKPPALWRRRDRVGAAGAPFWAMVNPADHVSAAQVAQLEAALAASGLLDAWVGADEQSGLDTFVRAGEERPTRSLAEVLVVDEGAREHTSLVADVLASVRLCAVEERLPEGGVAVALDGRWRAQHVTGRAAPLHDQAEWLGEAAREAQRQRRLAELRARLAEVEQRQAELQDVRSEKERALRELEELFAQAPTDDALRNALSQCQANDSHAEAAAAAAGRAAELARQNHALADSRRAELRRTAAEHRLPTDDESLDEVRRALVDTRSALALWRNRRSDAERSSLRLQRAAEEADQRGRDAEEQRVARDKDDRDLQTARARLAALRASINADDQQTIDKLSELQGLVRTTESELETLVKQVTAVVARRGSAESKLAEVERRREEATEERGFAHQGLRELLDLGVAESLELELPDAGSAAVDHVRAQAAELRRRLHPKGWVDSTQRDQARAGVQQNARTVNRLRSGIDTSARDVRGVLEQGGRSIQVTPTEPVPTVEVMVNSNGLTLPLLQAGDHLLEVCRELEGQYGESVRETLDRLLGSTFLEHLREQIGQAQKLVDDINTVLQDHPTGTDGTTLRIRLEPGVHAPILEAVSGPSLVDPEVAASVRTFLKEKVDEAKRAADDEGRSDWRDSLAAHLDYRTWYEVNLESRVAKGRWGPLTTRRYAELSGGARAVMLMLPLVAALAAQYRRLPHAPRPLWLDEAFDGLDAANRSMVISLLQRFDLDVLLAGPGRLVNVEAVPAAAIYQVVRATAPEPGADLVAELWAGSTLQTIDLPLSWLDDAATAPLGQDSLL
ncbi:TIGR02680 family protein [Mariniluteicoccus endophyticus]